MSAKKSNTQGRNTAHWDSNSNRMEWEIEYRVEKRKRKMAEERRQLKEEAYANSRRLEDEASLKRLRFEMRSFNERQRDAEKARVDAEKARVDAEWAETVRGFWAYREPEEQEKRRIQEIERMETERQSKATNVSDDMVTKAGFINYFVHGMGNPWF